MKKIRKRPKLGDVLYTKVPNGYKIYQWVFKDTRWGNLVFVFSGLYNGVPNNVQEIVSAQEGYLMSMPVGKACRIGFSTIIDNYEIPPNCVFPEFYIDWISYYEGGICFLDVTISEFETLRQVGYYPKVKCMNDLPEVHRNTKLISGIYSPDWILYLFDIDFNLNKMERRNLGENASKYATLYHEILGKNNSFKQKNEE
ncbi:MAG: hypothetical protein IJA67_12265 [Oscillospiraceae bacterium]|nr:hypothetical protein [Oscillospiraceae bacterium]